MLIYVFFITTDSGKGGYLFDDKRFFIDISFFQVQGPSHTKVANPDLAALVNQYICRLDVSVYNIGGV